MAFDYKKEYKEFFAPPVAPGIIAVPPMNFLAVNGQGDPNEENGEYSQALGLLYGVAYTIKMSYKGAHKLEGFFEYVVPPLEGFWRQNGTESIDYAHKQRFNWIALIRLPDFVATNDFDWAIEDATRKKKMDFSKVKFLPYDEGLCVQCMHVGSYDDEPATIAAMSDFAHANGYVIDITESRYHHEIYLNDPRKTESLELKTVIRHPIKSAN
ncbi:MAG: GyrI-like domain-containing protein [Oscillospiraceae bacterium]|jgi:hypothetical protein|nr:GyrI-like domain-containing protein [Oscillospiraceae bacterium]